MHSNQSYFNGKGKLKSKSKPANNLNSLNQTINQRNQAETNKQKTPKEKLEDRYEKNIQSQKQGKINITELQKDLPFILKPQNCINFNRDLQIKIYLCNLKDSFFQENLLQNLIYSKEFDESVHNELKISNQDFKQAYSDIFSKEFIKEQEGNNSLIHEHIMQLKCKIIDLESINKLIVPQYIEKYLYMLRLFYQYRQSLSSKMLFCSDEKRKQHERLKLVYFKMIYNCSVNSHLIQQIKQSLNNKQTTEMPNEKSTPNESAIIPERVITILIEKIKDKNFYIRNIAYRIVIQWISNNINSITPKLFMSLVQMLTNKKNEIKKFACSIIKKCLDLKPELATSSCPQQDKQKSIQPIIKTNKDADKKNKLKQNSSQTQNERKKKEKKQNILCQQLDNKAEDQVENSAEKSTEIQENELKGKQKSKQSNQHKTKTLIMEQIFDNLGDDPEQSQINTLHFFIKILDKNTELKTSQIQEKLENLKEKLKEYDKNVQKFPQVMNVNDLKPIKITEIKQIFVSHQIQGFNFSKNQNSSLNQRLQQYAENCQKRFESEKSLINQQKKADTSQKPQNFLYIISEYHHGKTLKRLIESNWSGFQSSQIVLKLIRKLFCLQLELHYQGFNLHIPTLNNIIVNDNLEYPDLNINMTEFVSTSFLFNPLKQTSPPSKDVVYKLSDLLIQKHTIEQYFPFVWKEELLKNENIKSSYITKIDRIKHFLSIVLFIICRRLDDFESYNTICEKMKNILHQKKAKQEKERSIDHQAKNLAEGQDKISLENSLEKLIQNQKSSKDNKQKKVQPFQKHDFLNIINYVPQFYKAYLKKIELSKNTKKYEKISYYNSNFYRIKKIQKYLNGNNLDGNNLEKQNLEEQNLFKMFQTALTEKESSLNNVTWRNLYQTFFMKNIAKNSDQKQKTPIPMIKQKIIVGSKLLNYLCQFFDYPIRNEQLGDKLPPQLFFALKYDISFCYLADKYTNGWFQCFQIKNGVEQVEYDDEVMCLLKNIKLEVMEKTCQLVPHLMLSPIQTSAQPQNPQKKPRQKQQAIKEKQKLQPSESKYEKIYTKVRSGLDLLRYLQEYEKKVYIKDIRTKQKLKEILFDKSGKSSGQKSLKVYGKEYFETISKEDLDLLEKILQQFEERKVRKNELKKNSMNIIHSNQ